MKRTETELLLQQAAAEITSLRKANKIMKARLDMFDDMMILFATEPRRESQGMSPDLVWAIEKHLKETHEEKED